jgi:hypothetical protein
MSEQKTINKKEHNNREKEKKKKNPELSHPSQHWGLGVCECVCDGHGQVREKREECERNQWTVFKITMIHCKIVHCFLSSHHIPKLTQTHSTGYSVTRLTTVPHQADIGGKLIRVVVVIAALQFALHAR